MRQRHFTLEEASALLPRLTQMLTALVARRRRLQELQRQLAAHDPSSGRGNGHARGNGRVQATGGAPGGEDAARLQAALQSGLEALKADIEAIQALGCELKDLDQGLIDFPTLRAGREVYLCWRLGEPTIAWWHDRETGIAGRQPL